MLYVTFRKRKITLFNFINYYNYYVSSPTTPFWTGRVMDYLFDGIEIDCTSEQFEAKATCSVFATGEVKAIQPVREDIYKFSIFGAVSQFNLTLLLS